MNEWKRIRAYNWFDNETKFDCKCCINDYLFDAFITFLKTTFDCIEVTFDVDEHGLRREVMYTNKKKLRKNNDKTLDN